MIGGSDRSDGLTVSDRSTSASHKLQAVMIMKRRILLKLAAQATLVESARSALAIVQRIGSGRSYRVADYGAIGDGRTLDTAAIQKAIDVCAKRGGGTVRLERGTYLSGSIFLRSHVTLNLAKGATLTGSGELELYGGDPDAAKGSEPGVEGHLIHAEGATDAGITGEGTIDGNGRRFWIPDIKRQKPAPENEWADVAMFHWKALPRPGPMLNFRGCTRVRVSGVKLVNSPAWTVRLFGCDGVNIDHVKIDNPRYGPNTDGIDVVCTSNVTISDCHIVTGDDAICLKSEGPASSLRPTSNITVRRCFIDTNCNGLKIGTGTQGSFANIHFSDCDLQSIYSYVGDRMISGIAVELVDGGSISGFTADNIRMSGARTPIFVRLGNRGTGQAIATPGTLRNVRITNIRAKGSIATSSICGIPGYPVEDIVLENVQLSMQESGRPEWTERQISEVEDGYPEARMFGRLPSYGLYCRHVKELKVSNLRVDKLSADYRPSIHIEDVSDGEFSHFNTEHPDGQSPVVRAVHVNGIIFRNCTAPAGTGIYVAKSVDSGPVSFIECDMSSARQAITEVPKKT
jgi:polygalacturonase